MTEISEEMKFKAGEVAVIELKSNPTTGYRWICKTDVDVKIIEEYIPDKAPKGIVGSGGKQVFSITSDVPVVVTAEFIHERSWESKPIDAKTVKITFV